MLTGKELGQAIEAARKRKGVSKVALAQFFNVRPPSVSDWVKRGTIDKAKLPALWEYFSDVVGPDHWGLKQWPLPMQGIAVRQEPQPYGINIKPLEARRKKTTLDLIVQAAEGMSENGRLVLLGEARVLAKQYPAIKANPAS